MNWNDPDSNDLAEARGDQEIEAMLREIPLKEPSSLLDRRLLGTPRASSAMAQLRAAGLGAAVAALLVLAVTVWWTRAAKPLGRPPVHSPVRQASAEAKRPLRIERSMSRVIDDGVIGSAAGVPLQQVRYRSLRQIWIVDPRRGTRLAVTVPDDRVVLIPVRTF